MSIFTTVVLLCILLLLVAVSAFFSSSETGMMAINRYRLRHLANNGQLTAKQVQKLLERPDRLLGVILIGNTFANILATSLATFVAVHWLGDLGVAVVTVILGFIVLTFAETLPKTVAALYPKQVAFMAVWPLSLLLRFIYPLVWAMNGIVNTLLLIVGIRVSKKELDHLNQEELRSLVDASSTMINHRHRDMLLRLLDLEKTTVEDIMVPRHDIAAINLDDDWEDIMDLLSHYQHKYLPVYRGNLDQVCGMVDIQHAFLLLAEQKLDKKSLAEKNLPVHFIPETISLSQQLLRFQKEKCQCGLVVDEYGQIRGFISLTDILEEIVGEFILDIEAVSEDIYPQADGSYLVSGGINLRELNRDTQWSLPTDGPKTLSGLIIEKMEAIPQAGTSIKIANYYMEVLQVRDNRIKTVKVMPLITTEKLSNA